MNNRTTIVCTHNGVFHADDVLAVAIIQLAISGYSGYKLVRTREELPTAEWLQMGADVIVVDVGNLYDVSNPRLLRFDHHQIQDIGEHSGGLPYASAGLVWRYFGTQLISDRLITGEGILLTEDQTDELVQMVVDRLIIGVDARDNGVKSSEKAKYIPYGFSEMVTAMNPLPTLKSINDNKEEDEYFKSAVRWSINVLWRLILNCADIIKGKEKLQDALLLEDGKIVVSEVYIKDGEKFLAEMESPIYWVYPNKDENWCCRTIPSGPETNFTPRKPLPPEWAGLRGMSLAAASQVKDSVFCHKGRFIAVAGSQDGAILLAKKALASP